MPKLPEQKKSTILEVAQKSDFNRGELSIPKIPKYRKVFKHHLKVAGYLLLACVVLTGVFLFAKPIIMKQGDVNLPPPPTDLDNFKAPEEKAFQVLNIENNFTLYVDRVDENTKVIYGKDADGKDFVIRVLDKTKIQKLPTGGKPVTFATESASTVADIKAGAVISVVTIEDLKSGPYLNAAAIIVN